MANPDKVFAVVYWTYMFREALREHHPLKQGVYIHEIIDKMIQANVLDEVRKTKWRDHV